MITPNDIPQAQKVDNQVKATENLYTTKTELEKLEADLKYVTGKGNILEVEEKIKTLKEKINKSPESIKMSLELHKNFEPGMSFTSSQVNAIESVVRDLDGRFHRNTPRILSSTNDLETKQNLDTRIKEYKDMVKSGAVADDDNLDKSILNYEKSFDINTSEVNDEAEKEARKLERARQEDVTYVKGKMDYLTVLENRLLEEQASAKVSILGRKDTSKTELTEKEITQVKRDVALGVVMAASNYLGFNVDQSHLGL